MCGITGIVTWQQPVVDDGTIERMTEKIAHRGPDATNTKKYRFAHVGHRRLAIIDVTYGHQPMTKTRGDEEFTIVYNGELYNALQLRHQLLEAGYHFETQCDTEVLLVSYMHWGPEHCLEHLNGIFSFGVWEEHTQTLFLARDRLGVKPLFYVQLPDQLLFASEMKALLTHEAVEPIVSERGLQQLLTIGPSRMPGETVFDNIKEIKPAHALIWHRGHTKYWRYWQLEQKVHSHTIEETILHTRQLLEQTVEQQLVSDVPVCTLLSGGIDSSILTALAANNYAKEGRELHSFSVDYEEHAKFFSQSEFQDARDEFYIGKMVEQYNTKHTNVVLTPEDLVNTLHNALHLKDYPSMVDIDSSLFLFCKEIARDFKVALSGECADELFGGYPWYFGQFDSFPWVRNVREREGLLKASWRERLQLEQAEKHFFEEALQNQLFHEPKQRMTQLNFDYFMQTLLERKDRMSMGSGLEVRVPFANHELVEYVWNVPWDIKTLGGKAKGLLRHAVADLLPNEIVERRKNPYPKVQHPLFNEGVTELLQIALTDSSSVLHELFDREALDRLIKDDSAFQTPWFGQLMSRPQLMAYIVQIDEWVKHYKVQFTSYKHA